MFRKFGVRSLVLALVFQLSGVSGVVAQAAPPHDPVPLTTSPATSPFLLADQTLPRRPLPVVIQHFGHLSINTTDRGIEFVSPHYPSQPHRIDFSNHSGGKFDVIKDSQLIIVIDHEGNVYATSTRLALDWVFQAPIPFFLVQKLKGNRGFIKAHFVTPSTPLTDETRLSLGQQHLESGDVLIEQDKKKPVLIDRDGIISTVRSGILTLNAVREAQDTDAFSPSRPIPEEILTLPEPESLPSLPLYQQVHHALVRNIDETSWNTIKKVLADLSSIPENEREFFSANPAELNSSAIRSEDQPELTDPTTPLPPVDQNLLKQKLREWGLTLRSPHRKIISATALAVTLSAATATLAGFPVQDLLHSVWGILHSLPIIKAHGAAKVFSSILVQTSFIPLTWIIFKTISVFGPKLSPSQMVAYLSLKFARFYLVFPFNIAINAKQRIVNRLQAQKGPLQSAELAYPESQQKKDAQRLARLIAALVVAHDNASQNGASSQEPLDAMTLLHAIQNPELTKITLDKLKIGTTPSLITERAMIEYHLRELFDRLRKPSLKKQIFLRLQNNPEILAEALANARDRLRALRAAPPSLLKVLKVRALFSLNTLDLNFLQKITSSKPIHGVQRIAQQIIKRISDAYNILKHPPTVDEMSGETYTSTAKQNHNSFVIDTWLTALYQTLLGSRSDPSKSQMVAVDPLIPGYASVPAVLDGGRNSRFYLFESTPSILNINNRESNTTPREYLPQERTSPPDYSSDPHARVTSRRALRTFARHAVDLDRAGYINAIFNDFGNRISTVGWFFLSGTLFNYLYLTSGHEFKMVENLKSLTLILLGNMFFAFGFLWPINYRANALYEHHYTELMKSLQNVRAKLRQGIELKNPNQVGAQIALLKQLYAGHPKFAEIFGSNDPGTIYTQTEIFAPAGSLPNSKIPRITTALTVAIYTIFDGMFTTIIYQSNPSLQDFLGVTLVTAGIYGLLGLTSTERAKQLRRDAIPYSRKKIISLVHSTVVKPTRYLGQAMSRVATECSKLLDRGNNEASP